MGHYNQDGKYVYSSMDVGNGVCSQEHYYKQRRDEQAKLDQNNAGEHSATIIKEQNENPDGVFRAVIVLDGKANIETISAGAEMKLYETVGLLEYAKLMAVTERSKP